MCCEQVAPPRYSSAGSSSELTEDYCEQYSDLFRPGEYGVSQQPGSSSCTSLTSCLVLCMSSSRLYPVLSDYFHQLYWCLASIKYKIDNFIFTFKHDTFKHIICFVCRGARGEKSQWGRFNDLSSGSPARTSPGGPTGTRRGAHHHNCCLRRQTCISKCCLFVTVTTCWSQIRHCPTHYKLSQILNCDSHGTHITFDRQSICDFNPTCHTTLRNPFHFLCREV